MASSELDSGAVGRREAGDGLCLGRNRAGGPCHSPCVRGERYCFSHLPGEKAAERRAEARKRGGLSTSGRRALLLGKVDFSSGESVQHFLESLCRAGLRGELPVGRVKAACEVAKAALDVKSGQALLERIEAVEELLHDIEREAREDEG